MAKFKVGDRVRIVYPMNPKTHNKEATIISIQVFRARDYACRKQGIPPGTTAHLVRVDGLGTTGAHGIPLAYPEWYLAPITDTRAKEVTSKLISNCTPREKVDKCPA